MKALLLTVSLLPMLGAMPVQADAFELLEEVRAAYRSLDVYHDRGEIEIIEGEQQRTLRFETYRHGDLFRLRVEPVDSAESDAEPLHRLLWADGDQVRLYDLELGQYRRLASLGEGLLEILGKPNFDALAVATVLIGSSASLSDPDAAALEGAEACGESRCELLLLSRQRSSHESLLWLDRESRLIRRLEVLVQPPGNALEQAISKVGLTTDGSRPFSTLKPRTFRVRHDLISVAAPSSSSVPATLTAPLELREVDTWELPVPETEPPGSEPTLAFDDAVSVELFRITTRVVDTRGHPVLNLRPEDFQVDVEGQEIPVASVDWVSSDPLYRDSRLDAELARHGIELLPEEKKVIFFVQAGLHATRIRGQLRTLPFVKDFVDTLLPNDRVAVVSFDSHLKLRLDFTRRHDEVREVLGEAIRFGGQPHPRPAPTGAPFSLAPHLDVRDARDAASPEQALEVLGQALEALPGDKIVVYLGWGLGRFGGDGVTMTSDYAGAVRALHRARATVFVLDVTDAGYHSLEVGLRSVAAQTGGTYAKTSLYARQSTERLAHTLIGHYVLMFSTADMSAEHGVFKIRLREKEGRVVNDRFRVKRE